MPNSAPIRTLTTVYEATLSEKLRDYISYLADRKFSLQFNTGAGRIYNDMIAEWPPVHPIWWEAAVEAWGHIQESVFPLPAALYAQAVSLTFFAGEDVRPLQCAPDKILTCMIFDAEHAKLRYGLVSPQEKLPAFATRKVCGLVVLCEPLNYHYHQLKDDYGTRPRHAASLLPLQVWPNKVSPEADAKPHFGLSPTQASQSGGGSASRPVIKPQFENAAELETRGHLIIPVMASVQKAKHLAGDLHFAPHSHTHSYEAIKTEAEQKSPDIAPATQPERSK